MQLRLAGAANPQRVGFAVHHCRASATRKAEREHDIALNPMSRMVRSNRRVGLKTATKVRLPCQRHQNV